MEQGHPVEFNGAVAVFIRGFVNLLPIRQDFVQRGVAASIRVHAHGVQNGRLADAVLSGKQSHPPQPGYFEVVDTTEPTYL